VNYERIRGAALKACLPPSLEIPPEDPPDFLNFAKKSSTVILAGQHRQKMKNRSSALNFFIALAMLCLGGIARAEDINKIQPTGYVMDLAGVMKPETKSQLEAMCLELQQKTGAQLAIVTVKSLDGNAVQPYGNDLYKHLGVGGKKDDNGVLLLVAPNDRKYWTEVGYGLEPVINDARAGDAGRLMVPFLRRGDYSAGVSAAAWQLAKYIADDKGVTLTGMPQVRQVQQPSGGSNIWVWLILGIILFMILASRGGSSKGMRGGGGTGSSGWWVGPVIGAMGGRRGGSWGGSSGGWGGGGGWGGAGGGFGGFGGGSSGGGGAGGGW
jgi:uncharacterized protein